MMPFGAKETHRAKMQISLLYYFALWFTACLNALCFALSMPV